MTIRPLIAVTSVAWVATIAVAVTDLMTPTPRWVSLLEVFLIAAALLTSIAVGREEARRIRRVVWVTRSSEKPPDSEKVRHLRVR